MYQRLSERGDVDKEHVIELEGDKAKLFFLKEDSDSQSLKRVKEMLLDSYEQRIHNSCFYYGHQPPSKK